MFGAIAGLIQGGLNYGLQKQQFQYQKDLNRLQMQREDNAVQRRAADLEKAGLSKTLAAGGAASAQPLNAGSAPQLQFNSDSLDSGAMLAINAMRAKADISKSQAETDMLRTQNNGQKLVNDLTASRLAEQSFNFSWHKNRGMPTHTSMPPSLSHWYYMKGLAGYEYRRAEQIMQENMSQRQLENIDKYIKSQGQKGPDGRGPWFR